MKKFFFILLFLCCAVPFFAQDTIVRNDSAKIVAKVLTINSKTITYQRYGRTEGPTYTIFRSEVARIVYADGFSEKFGRRSTAASIFEMKKNSASVTITDFVSGMLTLNYERIFWNEIGVRVSASRGLLASKTQENNGGYFFSGNYYYTRFKPLSLSLGIHYYSHKTEKISCYFGAALEYGQSHQSYYGLYPPYPRGQRIVGYCMGGLTNGVSLRPKGPLSLDFYTTLGFMRELPWDNLTPAARCGFNIGYQF